MLDLLSIGDIIFDMIISPEEISLKNKNRFEEVLCLPYGEKIPISEIHYSLGGSAANVAIGLARQNFNIGFVGATGADQKSDEIFERMENEGVNTSRLKKIKNIPSSVSVIISYQGEKTIMVYRGLKDYSSLALPKSLKSKWLFVSALGQGYEKIFSQITALVSEKNIKLAINPGKLQIEQQKYLRQILRTTEIVFLNRSEAADLCLSRLPGRIGDLLSEIKMMGPKVVAITDGPEGAYVYDGEKMYQIGVYQAKRRESTGAGDAFTSGFLGAILSSLDIKDALRAGVINSASVIEQIGAQDGLLDSQTLQKRLARAPIPRLI